MPAPFHFPRYVYKDQHRRCACGRIVGYLVCYQIGRASETPRIVCDWMCNCCAAEMIASDRVETVTAYELVEPEQA